MTQYLDKKDLLTILPQINIDVNDLTTTDSYHEGKIMLRMQSYSNEIQIILLKCAIQLAIIGFGNKQYGSIFHGGNSILIIDIFNKYNIKTNNIINTKLTEEDLTPRRLIRFFRFHIQNFIILNNKPSYLWNKYSNKQNISMKNCFPGAEYLIDNKSDAIELLETYIRLDKQINTNIIQRIVKVLIVRGLISVSEVPD